MQDRDRIGGGTVLGRYEIVLAYQQKPAPSVEEFTLALDKLELDPFISDHISQLKRWAAGYSDQL